MTREQMNKFEINGGGKPTKQINQWTLTVLAIVASEVALFVAILALSVSTATANKLPASGESCIKANASGQLFVGVCR